MDDKIGKSINNVQENIVHILNILCKMDKEEVIAALSLLVAGFVADKVPDNRQGEFLDFFLASIKAALLDMGKSVHSKEKH